MTDPLTDPDCGARAAHLMACGDWAVMVTRDGCGFSRWQGLAISRWHEEAPSDENGSFLLLRDRDSGACWSASPHPQMGGDGGCDVVFRPGLARFARAEAGIETVMELAPLPDGGGELRHLTLTNTGPAARRIEVISYVPLVAGDAAADAAHPAFSKMFVTTEALADGTLLAARRKRDPTEPSITVAHLVTADGTAIEDLGHDTDRMDFIGRGRDLHAPRALDAEGAGGRSGTVLDPVFSRRIGMTLAPGATGRLGFWTLAARARDKLLDGAGNCRTRQANDVLAYARNVPAAEDEAAFQAMAAALLMSDPAWRAAPDVLAAAGGGAAGCLWPHGVSGDRPILLVRFASGDGLGLMAQLRRAQAWWAQRQVPVDLVALAADEDQHAALALQCGDPPAGTASFVLAGLSEAEAEGLAAAARIVLDAGDGDLAAQSACRNRARAAAVSPPPLPLDRRPIHAAPPPARLAHFNGIGGFVEGGREYEIHLSGDDCTPQPWVNVVAGPEFGFMVSAEGGGCCWSGNSQTNTLTRWSNDPVRDPPGDMIYLRDMDSGEVWGPTPAPMRGKRPYRIRHGLGYSRFFHAHDGLESDLVQFVPVGATAKLSHLRLRNTGSVRRRIQVTGLVNWFLGANGDVTAPHVVTARDASTGILTAQNRWRTDYADMVAFADLGADTVAWTCDRAEVLGANCNPARPQALLEGARLQGREGAGLVPCAALQTEIALEPGAERAVTMTLGAANDAAAARGLATRLRGADPEALLAEVVAHWQGLTRAVQVVTPDDGLDLMVNGWLPYQVVSCRLHARTAFYQASGAWGFRDQLQDVGALSVMAPDLARAQILRAAGRQFPQGDVQHWWLPPHGAGLRTRMVDDRLWLPYILAHHVAVTGDAGLLDEMVPFLAAPCLAEGQLDDFRTPDTAESASLHEHAARAIEASLTNGPHGLPLFGTGDWNDGMNRVGWKGQGESVWMGWFLLRVIADFAPLAEARGEGARAARWRAHARQLREALEAHAWDGDHWLRGWYDDGTPLGAAGDRECRIDGIAQSWAVISGAADPQRACKAMETADHALIDRKAGIVALLTPPFDQGGPDPGYIKAYPPGLRENGGQYTHGSSWMGVAFAELGDGARAHEVFSMLAPISHSSTPDSIARWQVEPYVGCADVYTAPGRVGRGGWTWYSGTAGWLYRLAVEWILGLEVRGDTVRLNPCIPPGWPGFALTLRRGASSWHFAVENPDQVSRGVVALSLNGQALAAGGAISMTDDGAKHEVRVTLG